METSTQVAKSTELDNQKVYSLDEVKNACLEYFNGDDLAASTWIHKYAMKNAKGEWVERTPEDMHRRMAREFARIEKKYKKSLSNEGLSHYGRNRKALNEEAIFELFSRFSYVIPQGSVMSSLGNPYIIASLSNCIVLPEIFDSYGGIFYTDQQMAQLFKRRCGVGIDISSLRPAGMRVSNAAGSTSGAVTFMERFSNTTREVAQNGRRGALMITIDIAHPDVEDFVKIKQDLSKVTGANISVRISDEFMKAVQDNQPFNLRWPVDAAQPRFTKQINARELWETIIACAHNTAEPGIIFWDHQHNYSTSSFYRGSKTFPPIPAPRLPCKVGDSCRLIAINLFNFVDEPFTEKASFNMENSIRLLMNRSD
jgi:ribonucleoside-diphosphate reductase alpha chain